MTYQHIIIALFYFFSLMQHRDTDFGSSDETDEDDYILVRYLLLHILCDEVACAILVLSLSCRSMQGQYNKVNMQMSRRISGSSNVSELTLVGNPT